MALGVVGLDAYFLNYPTQCFFSDNCKDYYFSSNNTYGYYTYYGLSDTSTLYSIRLPLIRAQLATGVLMFVSCIVFIIIFAIVNYRVQRAIAARVAPSVPISRVPPYPNHGYDTPSGGYTTVASIENHSVNSGINSMVPNPVMTCSHCGTKFQVSA